MAAIFFNPAKVNILFKNFLFLGIKIIASCFIVPANQHRENLLKEIYDLTNHFFMRNIFDRNKNYIMYIKY